MALNRNTAQLMMYYKQTMQKSKKESVRRIWLCANIWCIIVSIQLKALFKKLKDKLKVEFWKNFKKIMIASTLYRQLSQ